MRDMHYWFMAPKTDVYGYVAGMWAFEECVQECSLCS